MKYPDLKVLVYDHGTMVEVARRLADDFGEVYYFCPWKNDYSKSSELQVGDGFSEIKWVMNFWDVWKKIDLFVFPQIMDGDIQEHLIENGKLVWGSREAECLEIYKEDFLVYLEKIGLATTKWEKVIGVKSLREKLYEQSDKKWIKMDANERGNIETFPYLGDPEACELSIMMPLEKDLGSYAQEATFLVLDHIKSDIETGGDPFVIDGEYPKSWLFGIEEKDQGYVAEVRDFDELPEAVKFIHTKMSPTLKKYGMRGDFSTEIKIGEDGKFYFIDPTMRMPYPPTFLKLGMWKNIAECMYEGAKGNLVEPEWNGKFGCEIKMFSDYAKENDYKLIVPDEIKEFVKQPYIYKSKTTGSIIIVPQKVQSSDAGSVISWADTLQGAFDLCKKRALMIKGHGLKIDFNCLDEAIKQLESI